MMPQVSVLLPVFDAEATLAAALDTLLAQTLQEFEVVAVDDGSGDASGAVLREYERRDCRIRCITAPHEGLIPALNRGLAACRAPLVARMDADDLCHPHRLESQCRWLRQDPSLSVLGSLVEPFPTPSVGEGFRIYVGWLNGLISHEEITREIFIESPIVHPSAVVRRAEVLRLGGYQDRGWAEDYDLWLRYHAAGARFAKVPEVLVSWREHPGRVTHRDSRYAVENFLRAKAHYLVYGPLRQRDALFVWGAGRTGRRLSKHLIRAGWRPQAFVDIHPQKVGGSVRQVPVVAPEALAHLWAQHRRPLLLAAVASRGARQLIRGQLGTLGLRECEDFLCVA
ncbi:MAG: glycosyltransferase [Candidatus Latescibacterota bacterium]